MRVHGLIWSDTGGNPVTANDIIFIGRFMESMGVEFEYWDKYRIHSSLDPNAGASLFDTRSVMDCDVLLIQLSWLVRFGGSPSKWDADVCRLVNGFDGKVVLFINDQAEFAFLKTMTNPKWCDLVLQRPVYVADDRPELHRNAVQSDVDILAHLNLNQSWAYAWLWKSDPEHMRQLLDEPVKPKHDFIYGGMVRKKDFNRRIDNLFTVFGKDNCLAYGKVADKWGMRNVTKHGKQLFVYPDELVTINSSCRFSALPYDKDKNYITSHCFEQGFADCLVLCDEGYNQEDCGFPVVDFTDKDAIAAYRDMPEAERVRAVKDQHERLASIDYGARCAKMMDRFFKDLNA